MHAQVKRRVRKVRRAGFLVAGLKPRPTNIGGAPHDRGTGKTPFDSAQDKSARRQRYGNPCPANMGLTRWRCWWPGGR